MKTDSVHSVNKALLAPWRQALYNFDAAQLKKLGQELFSPQAAVHLSYPFEDLNGGEEFYRIVLVPLQQAIPNLERRDTIVIAGSCEHQGQWVGCAGFYTGTMLGSWLDIPPTGHLVSMRFHEFYRFKENRIVEVQALWDFPELMMQANAWPMSPSLGREWQVPGPATQDGLQQENDDEQLSLASRQHVIDMLTAMKRHPGDSDPAVMQMHEYWHPKMNWYGPAGIGTSRGIEGFRHWHQIPFLKAMPDRGQYLDEIKYHFFAQGNYVAVTGWPNMVQTVSHDGWLGIAPTGQKITMRSLDFWRLEGGLIRENWVMVDLLNMYQQIGVDVFERLREFNKARSMAAIKPLDWQAVQ